MRDGMSPRQVIAGIAYVIRCEPTTWRQGLAIGDSSSCPQMVSRALRRHLEDIFPDMRAVEAEIDTGPNPDDAYPPVSPSDDAGETQSSPETGPGTGAGTVEPRPHPQARMSSQAHRPSSDLRQGDPAPKGRGASS
jgi:hypothetical protein